MSIWYEYKTRIDSRDVDGRGFCRPSALLGYLQEAATHAAESRGFGREVLMEQHGAFWMLARIWYELERPVRYEQELTIRTWHRGGRGASMYRDFDLYVDGRYIGQAVSVWVLVRLSDRKMLRLSQIPELEGTGGGELNKDKQLSKLRMPEQMHLAERRMMHYSDTDINDHVNNTRYADFACDAIRADLLAQGEYVAQMQIGYHAECRPGEVIDVLAADGADGLFVHGVDETGKSRFDAMLILGQDIP
ncbi:MAG: acyl-ACP thioesterase [Oscillospiraceae bacterium]|nr:acyl-ACP thioesterase [Oscillospiraceae bacterium]